MRIIDIEIGDKVVYIPKHLLIGDKGKMVKDENLGIVTSKNNVFVFVKYVWNTNSQATDPVDLFSLKNRPDLAAKVVGRSSLQKCYRRETGDIATKKRKTMKTLNKMTKNELLTTSECDYNFLWRCLHPTVLYGTKCNGPCEKMTKLGQPLIVINHENNKKTDQEMVKVN